MMDRQFIYFPESNITKDPGDVGLAFEDVSFTSADGVKLHGWFVPGESDTTLIWFHGNAGNIGNRVDNLSEIHEHLGVNVFIFDYRGYGHSDGEPSEEGIYLDAEAAVGYIRSVKNIDSNRLVLFGRSLGCAVAVETALRTTVASVVLESGFTSIQDMVKKNYSYLPGIDRLVRAKYDCLGKIKNVRVPVMILHGDLDDVVPYEMGLELFVAANEPKTFYNIKNANHNDTYVAGGIAYYQALGSFVQDSTARE